MAFDPLASIRKRTVRYLPFPAIAAHSGATFVLDPRNWIDNRLVAGVPFEVEQIALAKQTIRKHAIDLFLDVGANIGLYTVLLGQLPEIEQVIAFEPVRRNYNQLLGNVFANKLDAKVEAHRMALSDRKGDAVIHIDPKSTGVSRLDLEGSGRNLAVFTQREKIEVARFDDVCSIENRRIYMKIDVEGHTREVLSGMEGLFERNTVHAQIEITDADPTDLHAMLGRFGLRQTRKIQGDQFFEPHNDRQTG